jgi:hypothetical protein
MRIRWKEFYFVVLTIVDGFCLLEMGSIRGIKGLSASVAKGVFLINYFFNAAFLRLLITRFALRFARCS